MHEDIVIIREVVQGDRKEKTITRIRRTNLQQQQLKNDNESIDGHEPDNFFSSIDKFIEGLGIGVNALNNLFRQ